MFRLFGGLMLAAATVAPAQAATSIILNAGSTALPGYTTAGIIQDFTNTTATVAGNTTTITPTTNIPFAPGSPLNFNQAVANVTNGGAGVTTVSTALTGMTGQYLRLGSNSSYTISFANNPVAFFSFVFSTLVVNSSVTLNYVGGTSQEFGSPAALTGVANAQSVPAFGRVSYDVGTGPKIASVVFQKTGGNAPFTFDSIAAAAPEPSTWLMMLLGFGAVGFQLRRRKGKAAPATA